ncbi:LacI family DNA-binding transcriptional regulator [Acidaminobacter sp. JC074]|uniref:LacI family DNA-binding transcriptional regulator n=1 Tax=Acidaminobacter sp. JC074 TaxID=2530199 RepID=UPI001F0D3E16|nr:LacI family DNA-binding transcriptional regulator [Acidaminobacter sp. JC074]
MNIKIDDVAKRAGVSISSVSRVLNGYQHVSQSVKEKVNKAIKELDYHPKRAARSLASRKSYLIGILLPDLTYHYYSRMLSAIERLANEHNYNVIICNLQEENHKESRYVHMFSELDVDGIIVMHEKMTTESIKTLQRIEIPIVLASVKIENMDLINVNIDDFLAAYDATKYLINLNHKKIGMITGDLDDYTAGRSRFNGYRKALEEAGILFDAQLVKEGDFTVSSAYELMKEFLMLRDRPTAIFAASDSMAIGAMNCALDMGYKVPDDISFIGFDNIDMTTVVRPKLSTVEQPAELIGEKALLKLFDLIEGKKVEFDTVIPHKIIERSSCLKLD